MEHKREREREGGGEGDVCKFIGFNELDSSRDILGRNVNQFLHLCKRSSQTAPLYLCYTDRSSGRARGERPSKPAPRSPAPCRR